MQTGEIAHKMWWTWLRRGQLKKESKSLLIAAQNNVIRTNFIKVKIDYKNRLSGEKDEIVNHTNAATYHKMSLRLDMIVWESWSFENCVRN